MVMFLDKPRFDLTSKAVGGETATAGEVLDATLESMRLVDNAGARVEAMERAYDDRIDVVRNTTGQELPNPERIDMRHRLAKYGSFGPLQGEAPDPRAEFQAQLEQVATEHPEQRAVIAPERPILQDAIGKAKAAEKRFEDVWSHSDGGTAAWSARLAGGLYGSLYDPVNVATLAVGPAGKAGAGVKGLLWMGLKNGAANAGTEALIQPFVQQWRKEAGLDHGLGLAAINVAGAGTFGFGLDAGVRSLWRVGTHTFGGADATPSPKPSGDAPPSGARLPKLPEGTPASGTPAPAPVYRGVDPIPPMEALEQAARNAPEGSVLRRASEGDEDALRELAAALGPDADPAIRRALDELELEKLFPTPLHVDDGAHLESLARAIREESGAADLPAGDAIVAPIRREVARLADEVEGIAARLEDKPVAFRSIDPATVTTDASTFQFKSGGDVAGVTDRLRGVTRWDPVSAGKAIVFERADGSMVIADGHQRLGLAKRVAASGQDAKLDAYVFREADGWTPEDVRAYAALKNMRESSGTSVDMAQVMRDRPDLIDGSLPLTDAKLRDAAMLARLSPEAFDAVVAGRLPPPFAALIGESVADASRHRGLLDEMAAADLANTQQARLYLKQLMELPTTTETQMTLFGEESFTRTVLVERAQVLDSALRTLRTDKRIFGLLEDQAPAIEGAGNVLARASNAAKAERAAQLADLIEKLATSRGPVAAVLNDAAASVARGLDPRTASRAFVDRIADVLEREGLPGLVKVEEAPKPELAPVRMDDPLGPEAKAQAEDINWALELDDEIKFALRAYHGSGADFPRFRSDMIGTGEGEQVFGHGIYLAENENVGKYYQDKLGGEDVYVDGKPLVVGKKTVGTTGDKAVDSAIIAYGSVEGGIGAANRMKRMLEQAGRATPEKLAEIDDEIARLTAFQGQVEHRPAGFLYEVDIDAEPHQLLDHDAKLADQPEMLAKMEKLLADAGSDVSPDILRTQPGSWAYSELEAFLGSADAASRALKDAGIPGLRYFDAGSRGGPGEASRNIVIFDDSLIKITHKNGKAVSAEERQAAVDAMFSLRGGKADQTQTPEFKRWFGDSKVVDEGGKPLRVYHGTGGDIDVFRTEGGQGKTHGTGAFFSDNPALASTYASGANPNVTPVYLNLQNPVIIDARGANWNSIGQKAKVSLPETRVSTKDDDELLAALGFGGDAVGHKILKAKETTLKGIFGKELYSDDVLSTDDLARWARSQGYESVIIKNIRDRGPSGAMHTDAAGTPSTLYVAFRPEQIKSAIGNRGTFDPNGPRIAFALRGFYSPAIRAAESISMKKGTGEQFLKQITKVPGVRKDELEWMGLEEFLKGKPSVTRDEVLGFMRAHQVELDEKQLTNAITAKKELTPTTAEDVLPKIQWSEDWFEQADKVWSYRIGDEQYYITHGEEGWGIHSADGQVMEGDAANLAQAQHMLDGHHTSFHDDPGMAKFGDYKVPGGENYRELLIRLPKLEGKYTSKHFQDQEIVHLRVDDRTGPNGEKVLFINEVQSDLHQAGRQKGYDTDVRKKIEDLRAKLADIATKKDKATDQEYYDLLTQENSLKSELTSLEDRVSEGFGRDHDRAAPNAPFKGDLWLELALKRALLYASENGYDAISWARSDQIAKAVGAEPEKLALQYDSKIGRFLDKYTKKWGAKVEEEAFIPPDKEMLKPGTETADGYVTRTFYDPLKELLPRPFNNQTGARQALDGQLDWEGAIREAGDPANAAKAQAIIDQYKEYYAPWTPPNSLLRVTPQMRASVIEGQPLAMKGGQAQATPPRNATLHNTTLSTRAADEMASMRAEIDKAVTKSLPAGWRAEIRQRLVFGDLSERIQKRNPGVPPSLEIEGTFDPYEKIIYVSMAALDPVERAFEEAGHALKSMRLIPEADYGILQAKAKEIGAREKFRIDERYGDVYGARWKDNPARLEEALEEEAIMQMVAARARGDDFGKQSNAIIDKLIKFLRAIRDMLGLKGFRSFEDVFEDMTEGGFARAMDAQRGGAGAGRPVGGEVMAGGPGKTADAVSAKSSGMEDDIRQKLTEALNADDGYYYGLRVTEQPLAVGERAPPSKTWYSDFVSEDHEVFGREAFPDHGEDLSGPSVLGIRSADDIEPALRAAGITAMDYGNRSGPYGISQYFGDHVALVRSRKKDGGADPGEWILPDGEVVAAWSKSSPGGPSEGSLSLSPTDAAGASITQTPAFRKWFGGSKVVDAEGKPLVVYKGMYPYDWTKEDQATGYRGPLIESIDRTSEFPAFNGKEAGVKIAGFFGDATTASRFAAAFSEGAVYPTYLSIKKPFIIEAEGQKAGIIQFGESGKPFRDAIRSGKYDGVIIKNTADEGTIYIALEPTQIKSVFNQGTFDPNDPRISFSIREPESPTAADANFLARAQAASEIMFALGDEGKGKTPEAGGKAKPAPDSKSEGQAASAPAKATAAPSLPGGRESKRIRNLINQAAAEGKLPREDADALIQRFDMLEQFHKDGGKAKQQIAKELTAEAEHRKRQKDIGELRRRAIVTMMTGFRDARGQADPAKAMQALIENLGQHELPQGFTDVAGHQRAIYGMALADLDGMLHEFRKTLITGQTRNKAKLSDVVRELHGEKTGDDLAAGFAQALAKVMEDLRLRFNAAGGNIAKRKDWSMPQSHDKVALLKAGKQTWVEFVQPLLDLKWMKHPLTGDDMPPAEVSKMLGDVWDNLVSDGWHEREASMAFRGLSAIANTRADPRSLIFANANAWMKYSDRFGSGDDALAIIVSHIRGMTKDIAAMEVLGPNPKAMLTYMGQFVEQQAKLRRAGMPAHFPTVTEITGRAFRAGGGIFARDPVTGYAQSMVARAENMWNVYSGASSAPVNATLAAASQTVKNINVATKLGGATVSALSDPFWQVAARYFAGLPTTKIIRDVVSQIGSAGEREARRAGVIAETYLHLHNEGAREGAALSATKISAYVADRVLSLSMLNAVTRYGNHAMSMGIQGHLADMAGKSFGDLDPRLQRMFRRWGLEATDWDAIRLDAGGRARDVDFLSPADIRRQLVDNGGDPSIAERYLAMTLGEAQYATLTGSIRGQAIVYGSLRAGTAQRELWSMFMQFKSFAVNLAILQLERIAREFVSQGFWRGAQYATYALTAATLGGALIEQLQQLRNGKDPRDMTTPEFWGSAAYRSGGLSIWGDLLYASENRFGGGVASTIAGPSASTLNDILNLTYGSAKKAVLFTDNKERTNFGREATNFVKRYTPGASLWYVRAAWERVMMDNLQRMVDPEADASFRRKVQNARKDYKQEFWWKPGGGAIPQRGPRLGAALPLQ